MNWKAVADAAIRAGRTFIQTALGVYLATIPADAALDTLTTWDIVQAALVAGVIAMLWNILESLGSVKYNRG